MVTGSMYSQQCDIWSIGVILYLLLVGRFPFFSKDEEKLIKIICAAEVDYDYVEVIAITLIELMLYFINLKMSQEVKDLLSKMLAKNPAVRITAYEAMEHPWTTGNVMSGQPCPGNVLEMMRLWRSEMKVMTRDVKAKLINCSLGYW